MRILILSNSLHFSHTLSSFLTNTPAAPFKSSLRLHASLVEYKLVMGTEEVEAGRRVWGLEALQCDGIIYALVPENDQNWISSSSPSTFLSALHPLSASFPSHLPSILVSPSLRHLPSPPNNNLPNLKRALEVDPATGENCHLALLSLVYWITT